MDIISDDKVIYKKLFGGKVVIFDGDFRQILPIILKGIRSETT